MIVPNPFPALLTNFPGGRCLTHVGTEGDEERRQDSAFVLGSAAILSGLGLPSDELKRVIDEPLKKFNAAAALFDVFLDVLRRRGLEPLGFAQTEHPDEEKPEP